MNSVQKANETLVVNWRKYFFLFFLINGPADH